MQFVITVLKRIKTDIKRFVEVCGLKILQITSELQDILFCNSNQTTPQLHHQLHSRSKANTRKKAHKIVWYLNFYWSLTKFKMLEVLSLLFQTNTD